jgi:DNA-binding GntR family transcriptional regulator
MSQSIHRKARRPAITVDRGSLRPLYRQIYERVRHGIAHGSYQPGVRLPSARNLASELGIARGTVEDAYGLLTAEGYIERHGQGRQLDRTHARHQQGFNQFAGATCPTADQTDVRFAQHGSTAFAISAGPAGI